MSDPLAALALRLAGRGELRRIFLRGFEVQAQIGIHDFEKAAPQRLRIGVDLYLDADGPPAGDDIADVLDYDFLRAEIGGPVAGRRTALQETLAEAIVALCLARPGVLAVRVSTEKPDVYADCEAVGYEIFRLRRPDATG